MSSIRTLSAELQEVARKELFEVTERIPEDLEALKVWINKQAHLTSRTDDQFLLAFLRGCKFSLQKTKDKLENYYVLKTSIKDFYGTRDPKDGKLQEIMDMGLSLILPIQSNGKPLPRIILSRIGALDFTKIEFPQVMKVSFMLSELVINECDTSVIVGQTIVVDLQGTSLPLFAHAAPWVKKLTVLMETYPIRIKALHFINPPAGFEMVFKIFKAVVSEKIGKRVFVHSSFEDLHKVVSKSLLPVEYGGENATVSEIAAEWKCKLVAYRSWFLEDVKYGVDESYKSKRQSIVSSDEGIQGSFRKLEID